MGGHAQFDAQFHWIKPINMANGLQCSVDTSTPYKFLILVRTEITSYLIYFICGNYLKYCSLKFSVLGPGKEKFISCFLYTCESEIRTKLGEFTMVSQPIRLILIDCFIFNFFLNFFLEDVFNFFCRYSSIFF
jgi:hypothetical protein